MRFWSASIFILLTESRRRAAGIAASDSSDQALDGRKARAAINSTDAVASGVACPLGRPWPSGPGQSHFPDPP